MTERLYEFSWDFVGDLDAGRPNLGKTTRVEVYRLLQYTLRDVLEQRMGAEETDRVFYDAGFLAGTHFCKQFVGERGDFKNFFAILEKALRDLGVGVLRMEESSADGNFFILTVDEDLDCSGLPDIRHAVCTYDEGFLAGIFHYYGQQEYAVREVDCWCTGGRTCRFEIKRTEQGANPE